MATKTKRKSAYDKAAVLKSRLWHAVKKLAEKFANDSARDLLVDGESVDVRLSIEGAVGDEAFEEHFSGALTVGHAESTSKTVDPDPVGLVALLLESMPKTRSDELLATLPAKYTELGNALPEVSDEKRGQAQTLLEQLRFRTPASKRGAVRFQLQAPTA